MGLKTSRNHKVNSFTIFAEFNYQILPKNMDERKLGIEPFEGGVPRIEIEESEIILKGKQILWMLGLIGRLHFRYILCNVE